MLNPLNLNVAANEDRIHPFGARSAHADGQPRGESPTPLAVPIRSIGPSQRERIAEHLLALDEHDRYLRFGYAATDEQIRRYVLQLDFDRDEIYGVFNRKLELIAMAHLALSVSEDCKSCAEFGVSVLKKSRGRGFGSRLFERAVMHARNEGVHMLFIQALSENEPMLKIARKAGAIVQNYGSETEAHLLLLPPTMDSRLSEMVQHRFGEADYRLKEQAKRFHDLMRGARQARLDERAARKQ